jgi:predicted AAA+ superfamily ATPase
MFIDDMQAGKAGEYLVCADLIAKGYVAYLSEQGLPYDVVLDTGDSLLKIQVKATRTHKQTPQRVSNINTYAFNVKRCGKGNNSFRSE